MTAEKVKLILGFIVKEYVAIWPSVIGSKFKSEYSNSEANFLNSAFLFVSEVPDSSKITLSYKVFTITTPEVSSGLKFLIP